METVVNLNEYLTSQRNVDDQLVYNNQTFPLASRIKCVDGFSISVQATHGAYCTPRTNIGPWTEVECGFPSEAPSQIIGYAEDKGSPTNTVYAYVPIELVEALIADHGGIAG